MPAGERADIAKRLHLEFGIDSVKVPALPPGPLPVYIVERVFMKPVIEIPITRITVSF
jgi:hypothetical protein